MALFQGGSNIELCTAVKFWTFFDKPWAKQACLNFAMARKSMKIVNKQVKFLTSQYIGTCKSAYTKGYALNWVLRHGECLY